MTRESDPIDALTHLAEAVADDVRREAIWTGRTVRTTPKSSEGADRGKRR